VQVGNVDVARLRSLGRQTARIDAGTAVVEFVAASVRQWKTVVALADAGEVDRQVGQVLRDERDDHAFTGFACWPVAAKSTTSSR
jgi:hypothetical protein